MLQVYLIEYGFVCLFNSFATDISLGGSTRQRLPRNDDNHVWGSDTLIGIVSGMELSRFFNDLLFELSMVHIHLRLQKQDWGRTARAYDYAVSNQVTARRQHVVFNSPMIAQ